ncbi:MAG TPA: hypothetical protein VFK69_02065 [Candidatus Eisenbacteria bacterium]|nr:hypothetical protein [Candidatus Eisenbacteria bacterium]
MIKRHEFDLIVRKLELKTRQGAHLFAWFEHDGKTITRTRRSEQQGDLPMQHSIRQQLKLTEDQLSGLLACHIGRDQYVEILRAKKLL